MVNYMCQRDWAKGHPYHWYISGWVCEGVARRGQHLSRQLKCAVATGRGHHSVSSGPDENPNAEKKGKCALCLPWDTLLRLYLASGTCSQAFSVSTWDFSAPTIM